MEKETRETMVALFHLSDVHFRAAENAIASRVDALAATLRSDAISPEACFIVVTGDIAFSGQESEYSIARKFLTDLHAKIVSDYPRAMVEFLVVPGNHDCDFTHATDLRDLAIANLPTEDSLNPKGDIISNCLSVQANFFAFCNELTDTPQLGDYGIYGEHRYLVGAHAIEFHLYNTAWLSKQHEEPSALMFPVAVTSTVDLKTESADVTVALLHHPLNWLEPTNARRMAGHLERTCDIILTGHEHTPSRFRRVLNTGAAVTHVEGAVLQTSDRGVSTGFHIVWLDIKKRQYRPVTYKWRGGIYRETERSEWESLPRNPLLVRETFDNNEEWEERLDDPGATFTHPKRSRLRLYDLYVYPDLTRRSVDSVVAPKDRKVSSPDVVSFVSSKRKIVFTGQSNSGKTSLAKRLYSDLKRRDKVVPIMITGLELHKVRNRDFVKLFVQAFEQQYARREADRYRQLEPARRVIVVDDFEQARLTRSVRVEFIVTAVQFAASVLLFADDLFIVDRLGSSAAERDDGLGEFEHCAIRPFGYRLRGKLIERWYGLGGDVAEESSDFEHKVVATEKLVDSLIGKNLLPAVPVVVLTVLQSLEAGTTPATGSGAYGYLYEALITGSLTRSGFDGADVDTKYTYLAHVAYALYCSDGNGGLSSEAIEKVSRQYCEKFRIYVALEPLLADLKKIDILLDEGGCYSFKYKYIYCYFVARYLRDHAATERGAQDAIRNMVKRLHVEDYANILVFYLYLTKDIGVIQQVIGVARQVYSNRTPCNFGKDVEFANKLYVEGTAPLQLPEGDPAENRDVARARRDEAVEGVEDDGIDVRDREYSDEFEDILKINFSLKTLHVMGQVLKNFPGSLPAQLKEDLAAECYLLGLRTLSGLLKIAEDNVVELRAYFSKFFRENERVAVSGLEKAADEAIIWLTTGCAFGMTKRISNAVGLYALRGTFADVRERLGGELSVRLIDTAVKLDHFPETPFAEIEEIAKETRSNHFTRRILYDLVVDHMYLFRVHYKVRQKVKKTLGIEGTAKKFIANPSKITK